MAKHATFNVEVFFESKERRQDFIQETLKPYIETRFSDYGHTVDCGLREPLTIERCNGHADYMGNIGGRPSIVIAYQSYFRSEMPDIKKAVEVLDDIRDLLIKRKRASDVKYYVSTYQT
jgi:hypothetical protein